MSIEFLRQLAATPLPKSFNTAKDVDAIRILRQAGLVLALPDDPLEGAARVLAITQKGRDELLRFRYPETRTTKAGFWLRREVQRALRIVKRIESSTESR